VRDCRWLLFTVVACLGLGCPQERPGATKEIPPQRVPPAMSLEQPAAGAPDGGAAQTAPARRP
jgi:hypothetical protein